MLAKPRKSYCSGKVVASRFFMKRTEREELIDFIRGYDAFYQCYNFDLYSDGDLRELKGYIDEMIRSSYRFR